MVPHPGTDSALMDRAGVFLLGYEGVFVEDFGLGQVKQGLVSFGWQGGQLRVGLPAFGGFSLLSGLALLLDSLSFRRFGSLAG